MKSDGVRVLASANGCTGGVSMGAVVTSAAVAGAIAPDVGAASVHGIAQHPPEVRQHVAPEALADGQAQQVVGGAAGRRAPDQTAPADGKIADHRELGIDNGTVPGERRCAENRPPEVTQQSAQQAIRGRGHKRE